MTAYTILNCLDLFTRPSALPQILDTFQLNFLEFATMLFQTPGGSRTPWVLEPPLCCGNPTVSGDSALNGDSTVNADPAVNEDPAVNADPAVNDDAIVHISKIIPLGNHNKPAGRYTFALN